MGLESRRDRESVRRRNGSQGTAVMPMPAYVEGTDAAFALTSRRGLTFSTHHSVPHSSLGPPVHPLVPHSSLGPPFIPRSPSSSLGPPFIPWSPIHPLVPHSSLGPPVHPSDLQFIPRSPILSSVPHSSSGPPFIHRKSYVREGGWGFDRVAWSHSYGRWAEGVQAVSFQGYASLSSRSRTSEVSTGVAGIDPSCCCSHFGVIGRYLSCCRNGLFGWEESGVRVRCSVLGFGVLCMCMCISRMLSHMSHL